VVHSGSYYILEDAHLTHMLDIHSQNLLVYRAQREPHWEHANGLGMELISPAEVLLYRSSEVDAKDCTGLSALICQLHARMEAYHRLYSDDSDIPLPIPTPYLIIQ